MTWSVTGPDNEPGLGASTTFLVFNEITDAYVGLETVGINGERSQIAELDQIDPHAFVDKVGQHP